MRLRNVGCAAKETMPKSGLLSSSEAVELETAKKATVGSPAVKENLANPNRGKPVKFPGALRLDIPFSSLYTAQIREQHAYSGSRGPVYLFPCRLGLCLAYCAKGSNRSNCPWIRLPKWLRWEIASYLCGTCKQVSEFLKLPLDSALHSRFWNISCGFIQYHRKEFQYFRCLQSSRILGKLRKITRLLEACGAGLLVGGCKRIWKSARRAARGGCGSSTARGFSGTCSPRSSGSGTSTSLPMRWCCAACGPCLESGDCQCGSKRRTSILSVSLVLGRGQFKREFHKGFTPNLTEPCVVSWSPFTKSGRRLCSGQSWRCRLRRQCVTEMFSWLTTEKPTKRGAWIGCNYSCISRHNCCKTSTPGHSGLGFGKEMSAHSFLPGRFWVSLAGYVLVKRGLEKFVLRACFRWSILSVSWILGCVGVARLGTLVREG